MSEDEHISEHKVRLYETLRIDGGWRTAKDLAAMADMADRTARAHCEAFARKGVLEVAKLFGGYRYRIVSSPKGDAAAYAAELHAAKRVMDRAVS